MGSPTASRTRQRQISSFEATKCERVHRGVPLQDNFVRTCYKRRQVRENIRAVKRNATLLLSRKLDGIGDLLTVQLHVGPV